MSFSWRGVVVRSAPAVLLTGLLLGSSSASASVSDLQKPALERAPGENPRAITTTWSTSDLGPDALGNRAVPASTLSPMPRSGDARALNNGSANVSSSPLIIAPDLSRSTDALLGGIPPTYRPSASSDNASEDPTAAAYSKPKVEESLVVPVPAFGAGWALILGAGMYQIGARTLRLRR
jgi:hypothetical protein